MICSEQQIHEAQVLKETESSEEIKKQQWRRITELIDKKIHYDASFKFIFKVSLIVTQSRSDKDCKVQTNPEQQDEFQEEIQVATKPQQTWREQIEHHQTLRERILGALPMTTTTDDFQGLIRIEKDKQHMHEQDRNWTAVTECMMEVQDLSRRQARLGELEQIRLENCMACEEQIRSINHIMNITEVNDVKSVQEQAKHDEEKETQKSIQEAWKSILDMRNATKEPEKVKLVDENETKINERPDISKSRYSQQERRVELELEDYDHEILMKRREFYERMLQLGNYEAAEICLQGITRRIAAAENRSANRVGGVLARP